MQRGRGHILLQHQLVEGRIAVGGLVGWNAGSIKQSYYVGDGIVAGESDVGGLVGVLDLGATIDQSFTAHLQGSIAGYPDDFAGSRLVGKDWGDGSGVTSSFWPRTQDWRNGSRLVNIIRWQR